MTLANFDDLGNIEIFTPTNGENEILERLDDAYTKVSEMSIAERQFLNGLIIRNKPKKLLELGVSSGGSSVIMLNAIRACPDAKLYSIDYLPYWYMNQDKKVGYIVDDYPNLKNQWELFGGGLALKFLDKIGSGIDFCMIDTAHSNPGEILDLLMVLPYLTEDAIVVFHDVNLHTAKYKKWQWSLTNNLLMSSIVGHKILQGNFNENAKWERAYFPNIGAVKIGKETTQNLYGIFNLLTIKWSYIPNKDEQLDIVEWVRKYYNAYFINYIETIFTYHNENFIKYGTKYRIKQYVKKVFGVKLIYKIRRMLKKCSS